MRIRKIRPALVLLLALLVTLPCASVTADLYVAASGSYDGQPAYTDLQAAINAAANGDTIWVEDGFLCYTGLTANATYGNSRIVIGKPITVRSRSGTLENPAVIRGAWHDPENEVPLGTNAIRCVRMTSSSARLIGFRLEGGATAEGSAWNSSIGIGGGLQSVKGYNNLVIGNQAGSNGGGVFGGEHYNTIIVGNTSASTGGGAGYQGYLYNCTVTGNTAPSRAGIQECWLVNTITWDNIGGADAINWATNSCGLACTEAKGPGNTTKDPRLLTASAERWLPGPGSPARNSGLALPWMSDPADFRSRDRNGRLRLIGPGVDMGALEAPLSGTVLKLR